MVEMQEMVKRARHKGNLPGDVQEGEAGDGEPDQVREDGVLEEDLGPEEGGGCLEGEALLART